MNLKVMYRPSFYEHIYSFKRICVFILIWSISLLLSVVAWGRTQHFQFKDALCTSARLIGGNQIGRTDQFPIWFRVLKEPSLKAKDTQPKTDLSVSEWDFARIEMRIKSKKIHVFQADEEGWVRQESSARSLFIKSGYHTLQWWSLGDRYSRKIPCRLKETHLRIFKPNHPSAVVVRSDVDLTYLDTPLGSTYLGRFYLST